MKPKSTLRSFLALTGSALLSISFAAATDLFWSGAGSWDTANAEWGTTTGGPYTATTWSNSGGPHTANFEGTAGTVTIGEAITANTINLTKAYTLKLANDKTLTVNNINVSGGITSWINGNTANTADKAFVDNGGSLLTITTATSADTLSFAQNGGTNSRYITMQGAGATAISGPGFVNFRLTKNTTTAGISISGGAKVMINTQADSLGTNNVTLSGGIIRTYYNTSITAGLGTGASQFQITGDSGFSMNGTLTFTSAATQVVWGSAYFNPTTLVLQNSTLGIGTLQFANKLDLNGADRTVAVDTTAASARMNGIISGTAAGLIKTGVGRLDLYGANTYDGGTTINGGTLQMNNASALGSTSGELTVNTGGTLNVNNNNLTVGNLTGTGGTIANNGANAKTLTIGQGNATGGNFQGAIVDHTTAVAGTLGLIKTGTGTITLSGDNSYTAATSVNVGTLAISGTGDINQTSAINVAAGATFAYNSSTALTKAPTLNGTGTGSGQRAILGGSGPINTAVTLDNLGDVLSPGNSPGIQTYTPAQTWSSFSYDWEVKNFTGTTAGTHFDLLNLASTLNLSGGAAAYQLNVLGLTAGDVSGLVPNFSEINRNWTILSSTGITGFNAANWTIDTTGFTDPDAGTWSLAQSGNDLVLSYAAVAIPEPRAALLGGLGLLMLLRRRR